MNEWCQIHSFQIYVSKWSLKFYLKWKRKGCEVFKAGQEVHQNETAQSNCHMKITWITIPIQITIKYITQISQWKWNSTIKLSYEDLNEHTQTIQSSKAAKYCPIHWNARHHINKDEEWNWRERPITPNKTPQESQLHKHYTERE